MGRGTRFYVTTTPPKRPENHARKCRCARCCPVSVVAPEEQMALFKMAPRLGATAPPPPPPAPKVEKPKVPSYRERLAAQRAASAKEIATLATAAERAEVPTVEELNALKQQHGLLRRNRP